MDRHQSHQMYRSLLLRLRGGPVVPVECRHVTLDDVFSRIVEMLTARVICGCYVLEMVQVARKAIAGQYTGNNRIWVIKNLTHLGVLTLEVVSRFVPHDRPTPTACWHQLAFLAASLVSYWRPEMYKKQLVMSRGLKHWTSMMMCYSDACPSPALRLELLRVTAMWDLPDMLTVDLCRYATFGVMFNAIKLTVHNLLPRGRVGLLWPLRKILHHTHLAGLLGPLVVRSCSNIKHLVIGYVERSVTYLVVLMGQAAERVQALLRTRDLTPLAAFAELKNILFILHLFVATPPNHQLFEESGMCQIAATAIARTYRCIVETPDAPVARQRFERLLCEVNGFFMALTVFDTKGLLVQELQRYHGTSMALIAARMKEFGCPTYAVPKPLEEATQAAPPRFLDSRTGRLMDTPLRLVYSGQVVDRQTLLLLKLATAVDPQTGLLVQDLTYEPLLSLGMEILIWKQQQADRTV